MDRKLDKEILLLAARTVWEQVPVTQKKREKNPRVKEDENTITRTFASRLSGAGGTRVFGCTRTPVGLTGRGPPSPSPGSTTGCLKVECENGSCNWWEKLESYYSSCPQPVEIEQASCAAPPTPPPSIACCKKETAATRLLAVEHAGLAELLNA